MTYLLYDKVTKLYKIGITTRTAEQRRKEIEKGITDHDDEAHGYHDDRVVVLQTWKNTGLEKVAHTLLDNVHVEHHPVFHHGYTEWFKLGFNEVRAKLLNKPYSHVVHYLRERKAD